MLDKNIKDEQVIKRLEERKREDMSKDRRGRKNDGSSYFY